MATVTVGNIAQGGDPEEFLDIRALVPGLPALTDGAQLQASVLDLPDGAKLIAIVVPAGPAAPASATPARA